MRRFIVETPALDYVTVTTWEKLAIDRIARLAITDEEQGELTESRLMQYDGKRMTWNDGSLFIGAGTQNGRQHYIASCSGAAADRFGALLRTVETWPQLNTTRIDIQLTLPIPDWFKARSLLDTLRAGEWRGRARKCTMVDGDGEDTVYVGSYHSDRFIRIYVKDYDWLRFEQVYRSERAADAMHKYRNHGEAALAGMLHNELAKLPNHPVRDLFMVAVRDTGKLSVIAPKKRRTSSRTFRWFIRTVVPALSRLVNDHDYGERTRQVLKEICNDERN